MAKPSLVAREVLGRVARRLALGIAPPRTRALIEPLADRGGVEPESGDHHVGVARVGVDRDPATLAEGAPAGGQGARRDWAPKDCRPVEHVAHRARAVVAAVSEGP